MDRELQLEVICGTYEEFVVGYQLFTYSGDEKVHQFEQTFADHSHTASVRAVACGGDLLASGGADEIVKLYSMRRRTEMGQLMEHQGTITCLQFHGRHHLLSGSEDGRVAVVRVDNWQREKYLGGHRGGVTALAVHPSGRLALTSGRDRKLLTWDLVRGRVAFRTNLKAAAEFVLWSPDGSTYAVGVQGRCDVYSVATAGVVHSLKSAGKINCAVYISETQLACGDESGQASVFDVSEAGGGRGVSWPAHESRLRAATVVRRSEELSWLVTASSDGWIKVWQAPVPAVTEQPLLVASYNTTCRLTSVTLHVPPERRWPPAGAEEAAVGAVAEQRTDRAAAEQEEDRHPAEQNGATAKRKRPDADQQASPSKRTGKRRRTEEAGASGKPKKTGEREGKAGKVKGMKVMKKSKEKKATKTSKEKKTMKTKQKSLKKVQKANVKGLKALTLKKKKKKKILAIE
ncbi:p21-activated protein kinase-interacting protein 1-like isoform X2 [Pollicipes pollicipes]|nr:p21-activated protein kinase-interacting protein 1-like isoform X2 [Pollicipes pollicipes]